MIASDTGKSVVADYGVFTVRLIWLKDPNPHKTIVAVYIT
jgi:hypothetical protein